MKVHSNVSAQMTLGHGAKVTQITYLTAACRRAHRDDQNGHLDHPTRSPDGKVTPPGRSPTWPCQVGRLAWTWLASLAPPRKPNQYHCFADSQMDHQTLGYMPKVKLRPKGLRCPSKNLPKWPLEDWADHPRLHLHLHANKYKRNQCQPLDET